MHLLGRFVIFATDRLDHRPVSNMVQFYRNYAIIVRNLEIVGPSTDDGGCVLDPCINAFLRRPIAVCYSLKLRLLIGLAANTS